MVERDEAQVALDSIARTRQDAARSAASPWWYYPVIGGAMGLMAISYGIEASWGKALWAAGIVVVVAAMWGYSEHTGSATWATLREPGAWRAWLMIAALLAGVFGAMALQDLLLNAIIAGGMVAVCAVLGPRWDADWVRSLEEQP